DPHFALDADPTIAVDSNAICVPCARAYLAILELHHAVSPREDNAPSRPVAFHLAAQNDRPFPCSPVRIPPYPYPRVARRRLERGRGPDERGTVAAARTVCPDLAPGDAVVSEEGLGSEVVVVIRHEVR